MKTEKNIFIAFVLNLAFSIFEFFGGIFTGSVAIVSDAVHDIGDAISIGFAYFFEKKSKKKPDEKYTYGYARYSILGGAITMLILLLGSVFVVYNAIHRIINPVKINYNGMIIFAILGLCINTLAMFFTRKGESLNQKAVNLHMFEDVLGWIVVLFGAIIMKFTDVIIIDSLMSIGVAVFIIINAIKTLKATMDIFLEKTPCGLDVKELKEHLCALQGVVDVHHIHVWSLDGQNNYATMHVVTNGNCYTVKDMIRKELNEHGIGHSTLEMETESERCTEKYCQIQTKKSFLHHHH